MFRKSVWAWACLAATLAMGEGVWGAHAITPPATPNPAPPNESGLTNMRNNLRIPIGDSRLSIVGNAIGSGNGANVGAGISFKATDRLTVGTGYQTTMTPDKINPGKQVVALTWTFSLPIMPGLQPFYLPQTTSEEVGDSEPEEETLPEMNVVSQDVTFSLTEWTFDPEVAYVAIMPVVYTYHSGWVHLAYQGDWAVQPVPGDSEVSMNVCYGVPLDAPSRAVVQYYVSTYRADGSFIDQLDEPFQEMFEFFMEDPEDDLPPKVVVSP